MLRFNKRWQFLVSVFALVPSVLLIVVGILILVSRRAAIDVTFGVLILVFCALLIAAQFCWSLRWAAKPTSRACRRISSAK